MTLPTDPSKPADPTTPGTTPSPTALGAAVTAAAYGTPLALVTVWLVETYGTVHGQPIKLDSSTAAAIGSVGAGVILYAVNVLSGIFGILQEWLTRPPEKK